MLQKIRGWIKHHQKGMIVATVLSITGAMVILLINGKRVRIPVAEPADRLVSEVPIAAPEVSNAAETVTLAVDGITKTFPRTQFIRHLHEGWNASAAKIAQAAEMNIALNQGETIVNSCMVKIRVA